MDLKKVFLLSVLAGSAAATSCTQDEEQVRDPVQAAAKQPKNNKDEFTVDKEGNVKFKAEIVYFNFDDHTLTENGMARLNALADYMKSHPKKKLNIEGHCDSRGTTEYNLALGQLRAQAVKKYLATQGIDEPRLGTVSFGEEQPQSKGDGESSWAKNRRAEFKFVSN